MGDHIIRRGEALRRGLTDHDLQRLCSSGAWHRLHPGRFTHTAEFLDLDARARHRLCAEAVLDAASPEAVLSHQTAAVVHGLDLWQTPLDRTHLTRDRGHGGRRTEHRHVHAQPLPGADVTVVDGLRVTTPARTVVDLAATLGFEQALVAADHALHAGMTGPQGLADALRAGRRGRARIARLLALADGRAESVGETRSRMLLLREQLPLPDLQATLFSDSGVRLGRVDFLIGGVVGEFDGRIKYGRLVPDGQLPGDVVWEEKKREDRIRDAGWEVVRWTWDELATPAVVVERIRRALARAERGPAPSGRVVRAPRIG